jgi:hypothetical protein
MSGHITLHPKCCLVVNTFFNSFASLYGNRIKLCFCSAVDRKVDYNKDAYIADIR